MILENVFYLYDLLNEIHHPISDGMIIGRKSGELTFPNDNKLSGEHVRFTLKSNNIIITDLNSKNATIINYNVKIRNKSYKLKENDQIEVGNQKFLIKKSKDGTNLKVTSF